MYRSIIVLGKAVIIYPKMHAFVREEPYGKNEFIHCFCPSFYMHFFEHLLSTAYTPVTIYNCLDFIGNILQTTRQARLILLQSLKWIVLTLSMLIRNIKESISVTLFSRSLILLLLKIISKFDCEDYLFYGRALVAEPPLSLSEKDGIPLAHRPVGSYWTALLRNRLPREK